MLSLFIYTYLYLISMYDISKSLSHSICSVPSESVQHKTLFDKPPTGMNSNRTRSMGEVLEFKLFKDFLKFKIPKSRF